MCECLEASKTTGGSEGWKEVECGWRVEGGRARTGRGGGTGRQGRDLTGPLEKSQNCH